MNYTISLWRDGVDGIETKVLDIPRAKESPIGATTPTLTQNINGMKEFSFTLPRHYMKNGNELERNPLIDELIEESKIKLLVGEEWHDFIIKNINEEKANDQIVYVCQDLASVELGKRGVEVVLNTELENNYGTVSELAEKILEHSGYSLGADSEKPYESKEEALYVMRLSADLSATRAIDSASVTLKKGDYIYLPYSSVQWNNDTNTWIKGEKYERKGYQILWKNGEVFKEEDLQEGRVVYDPDFKNNLIVADLPQGTINLAGSWYDESGSSSSIKGRFLQESMVSSYEPVMDRIVEKVEVKDASVGSPVGTVVNKYTETEYWTSETTKNLLSNSKDFTSTNLWTGNSIKAKTVVGDAQYNALYFLSDGGRFKNESLTKTGIKLTKGEKYVYAVKGLFMTPDTVELSSEGVALNQAQSVTVELFDSQKQKTVTTSTVQWTPTTNSGQEYGAAGAGVRPVNIEKGKNYVYNDYVYGLLEVDDTLDSVDLYINLGKSNTNHVFTLLEVQLFKYQLIDGKVALPEDIPSAKAIPHNYYYKIENGKEVRLASVDSAYKSLVRANYEAVRHIEVAQNSYFNNINTLAEKFDMWVGFNYERDKSGAILNKYVSLYRFNPLQTTNWAGFKYGINLENIQRRADSTQITTKLVVGDNNNQFGKDGTTSIKRAKANVSKEGSIWNFDYYLNKGFLDKHKLAQDMYGYQKGDLAFITKITQINKELEPITDRIVNMTADFAQSEAFLVVEQEKMKKAELEVARLSELLEQYSKLLGSGSVASQSIENTEKAIDRTNAHYLDALKEVTRLQRLINYYKNELNGWKDKYKGLITRDEDIEKVGVVVGDYFTLNETLRKLNSEAKTLTELLDKSSVVSKPPIMLKQLHLVDRKRQLVQEFERLYHRYISEGYWNDASYLDDDTYFADAQVLSANNAFPKAEYEISLADIGLLDGYELYRFKVGDSTFVEDVEFFGSTKRVIDDVIVETPYKKAVLITESRQILDDPGQSSIVVKTYKGTYNDLITRVSYGLSNLEKELNYQGQRISETEKISTDARANRFLFENILNNVSDKINQYSTEFALELANAPGVTVDWLNKNVGVLDGNVLATNSIKVDHLKAGVMEAISAEVTLLVADALKANKAFIESLEAQFGKFDSINTGRIESADGSSWWDLDTGEINLAGGNVNIKIDEEGIKTVVRTSIEEKLSDPKTQDKFRGEDGKTPYLHVAYANSADGEKDFSVDDSNRLYIGQYTNYKKEDSDDPKKYTWSKIQGADGTGFSWNIYKGGAILDKSNWVKYDANGLYIDGEEIIFNAAKKEAYTMGVYRLYDYNDILEQGKTYTVSFDAKNLRDDARVVFTVNGFDVFSYVTLETLEEKRVVITGVRDTERPMQLQARNTVKGVNLRFELRNLKIEEGAVTNTIFTPHPDELKGDKGERGLRGLQGKTGDQGIPGKNGKDGTSSYTHIAYANSSDGKKDFDVSDSTNKLYIGMYVDDKKSDNDDPKKYKWTLIKGQDGAPGKGIKDTKYRYAKTSTPSPEPTESQWSTKKPNYLKGDYAWTQVIWEYTDGTVENSAPMMSYIAEDGVGISDTLVAYAISTTNTQPADDLFSSKVPDSKPGDYVWTRVTLDYTDPNKTDTKFYTVARVGKDGTNAKLISLSASEQVFKNNTPATITVTGLAQNTAITSWTYSSNSGAFTATLPAGVTRSGNTVTIKQSAMTANTLTIKASDGTYSDTVSIAKLADGASGTNGFTVLLTNESQIFPANSSGTVTSYAGGYSDIIAYYGGTPLTCTTTATGLPTVNNTYTVTAITAATGTVTLTPSLVGSNYRITPSALTTDNAIRVLTVVARVNNTNYTFKKTLTYTKSKKGADGLPGKPGKNGLTPYFHVAYANSADGTLDFDVADSTNRSYIGQYTNYKKEDSDDPEKYTWSKIQGADGTSFSWNIYKGGAILDKSNWIKYDAGGLNITGEEIFFHTATGQGNTMGYYSLYNYRDILEDGKTYTISFDAKNLRDDVDVRFSVNGFSSDINVTVKPLEEKRVVITGVRDTEKSMQVQARNHARGYNVKIEMRNLKIEEGAVENTIFTPHPDEIYGADGAPGKDGVGISKTTIEYAVNQSGTKKPTAGWSEDPPKTKPGDYVWTKTTWKYTDNTSEDSYSVGRIGPNGADGNDGLPGAPGVGIKKTTITYTKSTSGTVIPPSTANWAPEPPAGNPGEFIWTKTVWTYTNNKTEEGYSVGMIGNTGARGAKGDKGDQGPRGATGSRGPTGNAGTSVTSITEYYLATSESSDIKSTDTRFKTTMQTMTPTNKYLWNYEKVNFSDGTSQPTIPVIIGVYGDKGQTGATGSTGATGRSIVSITEHYLATSASSGVTRSTSGWSTSMQPTTESKRYLWNYETINWSSGTTPTYVDPIIIGVHGAKGDNGTAFTWNIYRGGAILDENRWIKYDADGLNITGEQIFFHTAKGQGNVMGYYRLNDYNDVLEPGKTYTVSFDAKNLRDDQKIRFAVYGFISATPVTLKPLEEKRVVITGVRNGEKTMQVQARNLDRGYNLKFEMRNLKIEEGAVTNTIFTPHPDELKGEDGDSLSEDALNAFYQSLNGLASEEDVKKLIDELTAKINETEVAIDTKDGKFTQTYKTIQAGIKKNRVELEKLTGVIQSGLDENGNTYTDWIGHYKNKVRVGSDGIVMLSNNAETLKLKDGTGYMNSLYVEHELGLGNHTARKMGTEFTVFMPIGGQK